MSRLDVTTKIAVSTAHAGPAGGGRGGATARGARLRAAAAPDSVVAQGAAHEAAAAGAGPLDALSQCWSPAGAPPPTSLQAAISAAPEEQRPRVFLSSSAVG